MSLAKIDFAPTAKKSIFVTWTLHNFCNYRCSYCPPGCHASTKRPYTADEVIAFSRQVVAKTKEKGYSHFTFAFSGGEPTLFPDFDKVLSSLYQDGIDVTFTSNASRKLEYWESIVDSFNHCLWSYHPEMVKPEEFFEKAKLVTQHCWLNVDFMMTKTHFKENIELGQKLSELPNIRVDYLPIQIEFGGDSEGLIDYDPEQTEFLQNRKFEFKAMQGRVEEKLKKFGVFGRGKKYMIRKFNGEYIYDLLDYKKLIVHDENRFSGWECQAGVESLIVNMDGSVFRGYCHEGGQIGTIWDGVNFPATSVICTKERCKCSVDIEVSKFNRSLA